MRNLFIVDIEPLDNRYTKQWSTWIPEQTKSVLGDNMVVHTISGTPYPSPQPGAFFDFASTCAYKAEQAQKIAALFETGTVKDGDVFFFTDAWNQTVHTVKYISELNGVDVKCAGIWHAGWYDPTDILGLKIKNHGWCSNLEASMFCAYDLNFFGTKQHLDKFLVKHSGAVGKASATAVVCGYPFDGLSAGLANNEEKQNIVVFPHRLNEDKAPYVFDAIEQFVHKKLLREDIVFLRTQEKNLSKEEYYQTLKRCKVVFSANKHENLGIGTFEAMVAGCIPLVPDKLSYAEMYDDAFKYLVSETALYSCDPGAIELLASKIVSFVDDYARFSKLREKDAAKIQERFFSGSKMMQLISTL